MIIQINRTGVTSKEYVLPITEDKAGGYTCKVTVGTAASSYSVTPSTISTTGSSLRIVYLVIYNAYSFFSSIEHDVCLNVGMNEESFK